MFRSYVYYTCLMAESQELQEADPLRNNQLCVALEHFTGQEDQDLPFRAGDKLWIVKPCDLMFWYIARNENGKTGMVPSNFLKPMDEAISKPETVSSSTAASNDDGYIEMNPKEIEKARKADMEVELAQAKEQHRRLQPGTLVVATRPFQAQEETDLSFDVYEELIILKPLPDLCWYEAQKTDELAKKGSIPITHVRLVYMSDDEDEPSSKQPDASHDKLYDDVNEFINQSGWFSFPGMAHSKEALHHVLAKKCKMGYDKFMECKAAVYMFDYTNGEKVFIGKAEELHIGLSMHFDQFEKKSHMMREIDDELCHHTDMGGWNIKVWLLQDGQDLEVECAKKIIEHECLTCRDGGSGITEQMEFTSKASFEKFWEWFSPPT